MNRYNPEQARSLHQRLVERARAIPGVAAAGVGSRGLMRGTGFKTTIVRPGATATDADFMNTSINIVSAGYFDTMRMRIIAGRDFRESESADAKSRAVIVNQAFVRRIFPDVDAIGQRFGQSQDSPGYQIVGVVSDAKYRSLREEIPPTVYNNWRGDFAGAFILHVRTVGKPELVINAVREIMRSLDPQIPFYEIRTLREEVETSLWQERLLAVLSSVFGLLAALLAAIGLYGTLAYTVARRTREIGIRMALGARPARILGLVLRQAATIVLPGVVLGLLSCTVATRWVAHLLYGVPPTDAVGFSLALLVVIGFGAIAVALPAQRAVQVDPAATLRQDA